ncbi:MAG TPA: Hsp70 family protein [Candidatus Hydrogenedentes bacterium]|nr:Hsp70 family protein [Candidatus Hydrogenedentota bacterium]
MRAAMIALDMGASSWRAWRQENGAVVSLPHRFANSRIVPFIQKSLPETGTDARGMSAEGGMLLSVDNYKRFLGKTVRRSVIGESSIRVWLSRRLAALHEDMLSHLDVEHVGIVIPVPSCFRDLERREVIGAAMDAGFVQVELPDETMLAVNKSVASEGGIRNVLYFHLGAGTFGLSLLSRSPDSPQLMEAVYEGTLSLGGDELDMLLMQLILTNACRHLRSRSTWDLRQFADETLRAECERVKIELASGQTNNGRINVDRFETRQAAMPPGFVLAIDQKVFTDTAGSIIASIGKTSEKFFARMHQKNIDLSDIDRVLIGGQCAFGLTSTWQNLLSSAGISARTEYLDTEAYGTAGAGHAAMIEPVMLSRLEALDPATLPKQTVEAHKVGEENPSQLHTQRKASEAIKALGCDVDASKAGQAASSLPPEERRPSGVKHFSSSKWAAKYGQKIAAAEDLQKNDPGRAVQTLLETSFDLLGLAKIISQRSPQYHSLVPSIDMLQYTAEVFFGNSQNVATEEKAAGIFAAVAAKDPVLGAIFSAARMLASRGDIENAREAYHCAHRLAEPVFQAANKAAKKKREPGAFEEARLLENAFLLMRMELDFAEAVSFYGRFEQHCKSAKGFSSFERRNECTHAMEAIGRALQCVKRIESDYKKAGLQFAGTFYHQKQREWQNILANCRREWGS